MKNDQDKPEMDDFYWEGIVNLNMNKQEFDKVIGSYILLRADKTGNLHNTLQVPLQRCYINLLIYLKAIRPLDLVEEILLNVVHIFKYGAEKYGARNYQGLSVDRIINAMGRHLVLHGLGLGVDAESGYDHLSHVFANILICSEIYALQGVKND